MPIPVEWPPEARARAKRFLSLWRGTAGIPARSVRPPPLLVVRLYLDQLVRGKGIAADRTTAISAVLDAAEMKSDAARASALNARATQVDGDVKGAKGGARVKTVAGEIRRLAAAKSSRTQL